MQAGDIDINRESYPGSLALLRSKTMPSKPATILTESMGEAVVSGIDIYGTSANRYGSRLMVWQLEFVRHARIHIRSSPSLL